MKITPQEIETRIKEAFKEGYSLGYHDGWRNDGLGNADLDAAWAKSDSKRDVVEEVQR